MKSCYLTLSPAVRPIFSHVSAAHCIQEHYGEQVLTYPLSKQQSYINCVVYILQNCKNVLYSRMWFRRLVCQTFTHVSAKRAVCLSVEDEVQQGMT
jgi:hypothetical protein